MFVAIIAGILTSKLEETRTLSLYVKSALNDGKITILDKHLLLINQSVAIDILPYNLSHFEC